MGHEPAVGCAIYVISAARVGENLDNNDIASTPHRTTITTIKCTFVLSSITTCSTSTCSTSTHCAHINQQRHQHTVGATFSQAKDQSSHSAVPIAMAMIFRLYLLPSLTHAPRKAALLQLLGDTVFEGQSIRSRKCV